MAMVFGCVGSWGMSALAKAPLPAFLIVDIFTAICVVAGSSGFGSSTVFGVACGGVFIVARFPVMVLVVCGCGFGFFIVVTFMSSGCCFVLLGLFSESVLGVGGGRFDLMVLPVTVFLSGLSDGSGSFELGAGVGSVRVSCFCCFCACSRC